MTAHYSEIAIQKAHRNEALMPVGKIAAAVKACVGVIERRNTLPILSNVKIVANGNSLALTGTDLDMALTATLPAIVDSGFECTLPAHTLHDFCRSAPKDCEVLFRQPVFESKTRKAYPHEKIHPNDEAEIAYVECAEKATVCFGAIKYEMLPLPVTDFPTLPFKPEGSFHFTMPGATAREMLEAVAFAVSTEETRYYLNGVYLHVPSSFGKPHLVAVATDGHRLARWMDTAPQGALGMPGIIIPRKTVQTLLGLWKGKACPAEVSFDLTDVKIRFSWDGYCLVSKLIDGTYPDYNRVIPSGNEKRLTADASAMVDAIKAVSAMSSERGRAVKISLENNRAAFAVNNPDQGTSSFDIAVEYASAPMEIGFNARYLLDIFKVACSGLRNSELTIDLQDAGSPTRIRGDSPKTDYVLMPMRV